MMTVDGIEVDDEALFGLAHCCEPERHGSLCVCCRTYEVNVDRDEIPLLDGCVALAIADGLVASEHANLFDEMDDGEMALDTDEEGQCLMAVPQPNGSCYCALHTMAMGHGLEPYTHKPRACTRWPVAASSDGKALRVTPDALEFPCNRKRRGHPKRLHQGIAEILDLLYGKPFRVKLEKLRAGG
jgi:hypothetical protein